MSETKDTAQLDWECTPGYVRDLEAHDDAPFIAVRQMQKGAVGPRWYPRDGITWLDVARVGVVCDTEAGQPAMSGQCMTQLRLDGTYINQGSYLGPSRLDVEGHPLYWARRIARLRRDLVGVKL